LIPRLHAGGILADELRMISGVEVHAANLRLDIAGDTSEISPANVSSNIDSAGGILSLDHIRRRHNAKICDT
jgi:hypothetical protein